jgi:peptidoglycan L-alanyl-D-glutamate endopeptidase CwlK
VVKHFDCSVIVGHRNEEDQNLAFATGKSQLRWPQSKHNASPSNAVDVAPWPIDWDDRERFHLFAGYVLATAEQLYQIGAIKRRVRWGGDWDSDTQVNDNRFDDLVHFELMTAQE